MEWKTIWKDGRFELYAAASEKEVHICYKETFGIVFAERCIAAGHEYIEYYAAQGRPSDQNLTSLISVKLPQDMFEHIFKWLKSVDTPEKFNEFVQVLKKVSDSYRAMIEEAIRGIVNELVEVDKRQRLLKRLTDGEVRRRVAEVLPQLV
ncbi:MAG: hypothetical protein ACK4SY_07630 [Pyrobaculum sp.]